MRSSLNRTNPMSSTANPTSKLQCSFVAVPANYFIFTTVKLLPPVCDCVRWPAWDAECRRRSKACICIYFVLFFFSYYFMQIWYVLLKKITAKVAFRLMLRIIIFGRPYWVLRSRLWYDVLSVCRLSVVCLSVTLCIVAKRYVVEGRRWYRWIGRW